MLVPLKLSFIQDQFYDLNGSSLEDPYSDKSPYKESISIHPVSDSNSFYYLHQFSLYQRLNATAR